MRSSRDDDYQLPIYIDDVSRGEAFTIHYAPSVAVYLSQRVDPNDTQLEATRLTSLRNAIVESIFKDYQSGSGAKHYYIGPLEEKDNEMRVAVTSDVGFTFTPTSRIGSRRWNYKQSDTPLPKEDLALIVESVTTGLQEQVQSRSDELLASMAQEMHSRREKETKSKEDLQTARQKAILEQQREEKLRDERYAEILRNAPPPKTTKRVVSANTIPDYQTELAIQDRLVQSLDERLKKINASDTKGYASDIGLMKKSISDIELKAEAKINAIKHSLTAGKMTPDLQAKINDINAEKDQRIILQMQQHSALVQRYKAFVEAEEKSHTLERKQAEHERRKDDLISISHLFKELNKLQDIDYSIKSSKSFGFDLSEDNKIIVDKALEKIEKLKNDLKQLSTDPEFLEQLVSGSIDTKDQIPGDVNLAIVSTALAALQKQVDIVRIEKERFEALRQLEAQQIEFETLIKDLRQNLEESKMIPETIHDSLKKPVSDSIDAINQIINENKKVLNPNFTSAIRSVGMSSNPKQTMEEFNKLREDLLAIKYEIVNLKTFQEQSLLLQQKEFYSQLKSTLTTLIPEWDKEHAHSGTSILFNGKPHRVPQGISEILKIMDPKFQKQTFRFFKKKVDLKQGAAKEVRDDIQNLLEFKKIAEQRLRKKSAEKRDPNSANTIILTLLAQIDINKLNDPGALKALNEQLLSIAPKQAPQQGPKPITPTML